MRHTHTPWIAALLAALAVAGCKPGGSKGACGSGETANADPAFCYKLPAGFAARGEPVARKGWFNIAYSGDDKASVNFIALGPDGFDARWKELQGNSKSAKATDAKEEEFAGGKGKILTYTTPEKEPRFIVSAVYRGAKSVLGCEAEYRVSAPKPALVDACKSIHEP